jgi:hypothetical protein
VKLAIILVIIVIVIIVCWWILGVYNVRYPGPSRPDADFERLIDEFESYPKELWYRDDKRTFDQWLSCRPYRFIVYESDGEVVYDSCDNTSWKYHKYYRKSNACDNAEQLTRSVEYIRAAALTQGVALRKLKNGKLANVAELVKDGDYYRIVIISEYESGAIYED